ncbi:MAG: PIN domain-containing protein [Candidatus Omnitrophica bacterium]|nr:PIN domain-containing protein [Candidatus Omnitrophota bacterium]
MPAQVLDSFALLAYFRGEPSGALVRELLYKASKADKPIHMCEANYAEVKYMILRKDGVKAWNKAGGILLALPIEFHPVDRELADLAADIKSRHRLSLADAFAAALARKQEADLVTGDVEFKSLEKEIRVLWMT